MRTRAAILSLVVALTALLATVHEHVQVRDGFHDASPNDTCARDEGVSGSCSICRLAHETSAGPVSPGQIARPLTRSASTKIRRSRVTSIARGRRRPSRAPPTAASC